MVSETNRRLLRCMGSINLKLVPNNLVVYKAISDQSIMVSTEAPATKLSPDRRASRPQASSLNESLRIHLVSMDRLIWRISIATPGFL